jgi:enolase
VGDDVLCTSAARLLDGIEGHLANSILLKVNQVGTITEMMDTWFMAHR